MTLGVSWEYLPFRSSENRNNGSERADFVTSSGSRLVNCRSSPEKRELAARRLSIDARSAADRLSRTSAIDETNRLGMIAERESLPDVVYGGREKGSTLRRPPDRQCPCWHFPRSMMVSRFESLHSSPRDVD